MATETTAIQPAPRTMFDIQGAAAKMKEWEEAKSALLTTEKDKVKIGNGVHITRKGWDKIALSANVECTIVDYKTEKEGDWDPSNAKGDFTATVIARAVTSWGRRQDGIGAYSASEFISKEGKRLPISKHSVIARAATRAHNRAIADLVGGGEVSAEEMVPDVETKADAVNDKTDSGVTREEVEYAAKDFGDSVKVEEALDGFRVRLMKSLSKPEFDSLKNALANLGGTYEPAKGAERPCFLVKKA
jgi:hypothetical protein